MASSVTFCWGENGVESLDKLYEGKWKIWSEIKWEESLLPLWNQSPHQSLPDSLPVERFVSSGDARLFCSVRIEKSNKHQVLCDNLHLINASWDHADLNTNLSVILQTQGIWGNPKAHHLMCWLMSCVFNNGVFIFTEQSVYVILFSSENREIKQAAFSAASSRHQTSSSIQCIRMKLFYIYTFKI